MEMTSLHVSVTRDQRDYVHRRATEGGYGTPSEFVRALIRRDQREHEKESTRRELEIKVLEVIERGDYANIDEDFLKRLYERVTPRGR